MAGVRRFLPRLGSLPWNVPFCAKNVMPGMIAVHYSENNLQFHYSENKFTVPLFRK